MGTVIICCIAMAIGFGIVQFRQRIYDAYQYDFLGVMNNLLAFGGMSAIFLLVGMAVVEGDWSGYIAFVIGGLLCEVGLMYRHIKAMGLVKGMIMAIVQPIGTFGIILLKGLEYGAAMVNVSKGGRNTPMTGTEMIKPLNKGMSEREYCEQQGANDKQ